MNRNVSSLQRTVPQPVLPQSPTTALRTPQLGLSNSAGPVDGFESGSSTRAGLFPFLGNRSLSYDEQINLARGPARTAVGAIFDGRMNDAMKAAADGAAAIRERAGLPPDGQNHGTQALGAAWSIAYTFRTAGEAATGAANPAEALNLLANTSQHIQRLESTGLISAAEAQDLRGINSGWVQRIEGATPHPGGERFSLRGSVGAGGVDNPDDVAKVRNRLAELGYPTDNLNRSIQLFQSAIFGSGRLAGDGRVDVDGETHRWLQAENAPSWQEMPRSGPGFNNVDDNDHDYGTDWTIDMVLEAGKIYANSHNGAPISTNNLSLPTGGDTPFHGTHETGLNVDVVLPRTDGSAGGITWRDGSYDREATKAQIRALVAAGAESILFNDPEILRDPEFSGIVRSYAGHDDHLHITVSRPNRIDPE